METEKQKPLPMKVYPLDETWFEGVSPDAERHLRNSLDSLARGRAPTPSFKLYGKSDVSVVDDFFKQVKRAGIQVPEWLLTYEQSRKAKFGPQGGFKPWSDLKEAFELYFSRPNFNAEYRIHDNVLAKYKQLHLVRPSLRETMKALIATDKIQDRASGWRHFNLKKTNAIAQRDALADARSGFWRRGFTYTFSRYNKLKARIFMPGPFSDMILEAQWYARFLSAIQTSLRTQREYSPFTFWADKIGFDPMFEDIVTPLCRRFDPTHFVYVQRDFEKMDTTQSFQQTKLSMLPRLAAAYNINIDSSTYHEMYEVFEWGGNIPIATPDGVYTGSHGKASGANTTNGDETCGNEDYDADLTDSILSECASRGIRVELVYSGGNGDDGASIWYLDDLERLSEFKSIVSEAATRVAEQHGYRVQGDKWFISTEYGIYCQRVYYWVNNHMLNMYPATLILNSIINPEWEYAKSQWDKDYRDLDIIEKLDNGVNLPYYHLLVDYVDNGMKYRLLGRSEDETRRILSKWERYRALRQDPFNYRTYDISDISSSPTVQYLLSKRKIALR